MTGVRTWTVQRLLEWTTPFLQRQGVDAPRLSAELLLANVLECPRIRLYTDYQRPLQARELDRFRDLVRRAADHEPIAYLTGRAHFYNLEFHVTRDVLIPRPDTETLVEQAIAHARRTPGLETPRVLDLCTGSGCVAAALAQQLPGATIVAADISAAACAVARDNLARLGLSERATVLQGDLFEALRGTADAAPFDLIVANPPYIASAALAALDRCVRDFEPSLALDGGLDGLALHRRILDEAADRLLPRGRVLLEIAFDQAQAARDLLATRPRYRDARILRDHGGNDRVLSVGVA